MSTITAQPSIRSRRRRKRNFYKGQSSRKLRSSVAAPGTATTTATFYVTNWPPSGIYAEMRLELRPDAPYPGGDWPGIQIDITQPGGVVYTSNKPNAQYQSTLPHTMFGVQAPDSSYGMFPTMITLWTTDGGITVFADVDTVNVMGSLYGTGYYPKNTYTVV